MSKLGTELLRLVDMLHRDKDIDREIVFCGIEAALVSAARKHFGSNRDVTVEINRETGDLEAYDEETEITPSELGRIAAQTAKQVMIQKIREAERESIAADMTDRLLSVVSGSVHRLDGPNIVVRLDRGEGFLPRSEQIPGENYRVGERIRALVLEVKPSGSRVRIILSRARPEFVTRLFELEVPEVADGVVEIRGIAREAGYRTKVAVASLDARVDCVGACVGVQGSRIRNVVDELGGEKIDIVRWSDQPDMLIGHALKPAEISGITLDEKARRANVVVPQDQLSLAIGKRGQNVRLVCKLTGWEIDISAPEAEPANEETPIEDASTGPQAEASADDIPADAAPEAEPVDEETPIEDASTEPQAEASADAPPEDTDPADPEPAPPTDDTDVPSTDEAPSEEDADDAEPKGEGAE